jgi:hypothetical protein
MYPAHLQNMVLTDAAMCLSGSAHSWIMHFCLLRCGGARDVEHVHVQDRAALTALDQFIILRGVGSVLSIMRARANPRSRATRRSWCPHAIGRLVRSLDEGPAWVQNESIDRKHVCLLHAHMNQLIHTPTTLLIARRAVSSLPTGIPPFRPWLSGPWHGARSCQANAAPAD